MPLIVGKDGKPRCRSCGFLVPRSAEVCPMCQQRLRPRALPTPVLVAEAAPISRAERSGITGHVVDAALGLAVGVVSPELGVVTYSYLRHRRGAREDSDQRERTFTATLIAASEASPKPAAPAPAPFVPPPEPDPGRWSCPRCHRGLETETVAELHLHGCERCGGVAVEAGCVAGLGAPERQAQLLARAAHWESLGQVPVDGRAVVYLDCPRCSGPMVRHNFERVSGVIVDRCPQHGLWFDPGELERSLAFLSQGGREKKARFEAQEAERQAAEKAKIREIERRTPRYHGGYEPDWDL